MMKRTRNKRSFIHIKAKVGIVSKITKTKEVITTETSRTTISQEMKKEEREEEVVVEMKKEGREEEVAVVEVEVIEVAEVEVDKTENKRNTIMKTDLKRTTTKSIRKSNHQDRSLMIQITKRRSTKREKMETGIPNREEEEAVEMKREAREEEEETNK